MYDATKRPGGGVPMDRQRLLAVARGDEPADLVLTGGRLLNVFTGEVLEQAVSVAEGRVAAVGEPRRAAEVVDVAGCYVVPGLMDAHVHLESSLLTPYEYARAVVPRGTTAVVCDPHEIANVAGMAGIRWFLQATEGLPLTVLVNAPSCVPATSLATSGAQLDAGDLGKLARLPRVVGLAEVMNVPGTVQGDPGVWAKIDAFSGRPLDGHAPGLAGPLLQAYAAAGIGTDHECLTAAEAREKLRLGLRILLREGTGAHNLEDLLPVVDRRTASRCALCTDDRHPHDLLDEGHMDYLVRRAVGCGLDPVTAIQMATVNVAETYGLHLHGAVAPGRRADMVVCGDLRRMDAHRVFSGGRLVARDGEPVGGWERPAADERRMRGTVRLDASGIDLAVKDRGGPVRVIVARPGRLVTDEIREVLPAEHGLLCSDPARDTVKLAVIERHGRNGNAGLGFVRGLGIRRGAIASTVAHDHHNLVIAGADDVSMLTAASALAGCGGGLVVAEGTTVRALVPLPLGGLMSDRPLHEVRGRVDRLLAASRELGTGHPDPFMALSFLALEVIPSLKLTDRGLVDVVSFRQVPLFVGDG